MTKIVSRTVYLRLCDSHRRTFHTFSPSRALLAAMARRVHDRLEVREGCIRICLLAGAQPGVETLEPRVADAAARSMNHTFNRTWCIMPCACVRRRAAGSQEALVFRITNDEAIYHTTTQLGSSERFTRAARSGCVSVCVCFVCTLAYVPRG